MLNDHRYPINQDGDFITAAFAKKFTLLNEIHTAASDIKQEILKTAVFLHLGSLRDHPFIALDIKRVIHSVIKYQIRQ